MKRRDIFRVPARIERRSDPERVWKDSNGVEKRIPATDLGWFMIVRLGQAEHAFGYGPDKPMLKHSPINLVLEYETDEDAPSSN